MTLAGFQTAKAITIPAHTFIQRLRDGDKIPCTCGVVFDRSVSNRQWRRAVRAHTVAAVRAAVGDPKLRVFTDLAKAGKVLGETQGYEGRPGGWIYRNDVPVVQGWAMFGARKCASREIVRVVDARGQQQGAWVIASEMEAR